MVLGHAIAGSQTHCNGDLQGGAGWPVAALCF